MLKTDYMLNELSCNATKKLTMEDRDTTSISSSTSWQSNVASTSRCVGEYLVYREIWIEPKHQSQTELSVEPHQHWQSISCMHHSGTPANLCSLLCRALLIHPCFLLCLTSGLSACSIFVTYLFAAAMALEGIDKDNLPCGLDKLSGWETGNHAKNTSQMT